MNRGDVIVSITINHLLFGMMSSHRGGFIDNNNNNNNNNNKNTNKQSSCDNNMAVTTTLIASNNITSTIAIILSSTATATILTKSFTLIIRTVQFTFLIIRTVQSLARLGQLQFGGITYSRYRAVSREDETVIIVIRQSFCQKITIQYSNRLFSRQGNHITCIHSTAYTGMKMS